MYTLNFEYLRAAIVFDELCYGKSELCSRFTSSYDGCSFVKVEALSDGQKEKDDVYHDDRKRRRTHQLLQPHPALQHLPSSKLMKKSECCSTERNRRSSRRLKDEQRSIGL